MKKNILDVFDLDDTLKAFVVSIGRAIARNPDLLLAISRELNDPEWGDLANGLQNQIERDHFLKNINNSADLYDWGSIEETYRTWGKYGWITDHTMVFYGFWESCPLTQVDADSLVTRALDSKKFSKLKVELSEKTDNYNVYYEAIKCFDNRCYAACASLLISLIDGELIRCRCSLTSNNKKTGLKAGERMIDSVSKDNEYSYPGLFHLELVNYEAYINTLFARADGFVKEPKSLNRNYLHHGMSKRKVLRKDCIKLLLAYRKTLYFTKCLENL